MAVNEIDPACDMPRADRKTRVRIDWKRGAALLVAGEAPDAVATALGIEVERLWRHLRRSARFQFLLRQARETQLLLGRLQLEAASNAAAIRCAQKAEKPPAGLFEQFKTSSAPAWAQPSSVDGRDMVLRLAESLRRAPKRPPRSAKAQDKDAISENKTLISGDKAGISPHKSPTGADKPAASTDKAASDEDKVLKEQPAASQPPASPSPSRCMPQDRRLPGLQNGGIVDLTDMHGHPLPTARSEAAANGIPARADAWPG